MSELPQARKRILIVDDSKTVLLSTRLLLTGYEVSTALDGEQCLAKARAERPDLILLDLVMPRMDGFETCRRLRQLEETRDTPIIITTTRGEPHNIQAGYECGCSEYLMKPFDGGELLERIRNFIGS